MSQDYIPVQIMGTVKIFDTHTKEILRHKRNAIHPQNMSRIIARALAREQNSYIFRMAFGNGGSQIDSVANIIFNPPNTGETDGWQSRLYNETYSEIVDENNINFKQDPGSCDSSNCRLGGGASPLDDPSNGGVESVEVGVKSNVIITVVLNEHEPSGQVLTDDLGVVVDDYEKCFLFDEIGLYSPGLPARHTNGYANVDVNTKTSTDVAALAVSSAYNLEISVNGTAYSCVITTPASGTGSGGEITYGDLCEGINDGSWITSGTNISTLVYVYITDDSEGTYPTIINKQSYGYLTFQSRTTGINSVVSLTCIPEVGDFFYTLTGNDCADCNITAASGVNAGVQNDPVVPDNERERLLTHFIFSPILKSGDRSITIEYTLTVSVGQSSDSEVFQEIT
jgi:hypothetical protein